MASIGSASQVSLDTGQALKRADQRKTSLLDTGIFVGLALVAFLPRIFLAAQLDLVTDEVIYLRAGQIYLSLFPHFGSFAWKYNAEHPSFVKLLFGMAQSLNTTLGQGLGELLAGRLPSVLSGTLLILAVYGLGRAPFGRLVALASALCLAFSPWLAYFSALAYLDMTMVTLMSVAFLLLWHALRRPWLYPLSALLVGLGVASKYTAALVIPGMLIFIFYSFPSLLPAKRGHPWRWLLLAFFVAPLSFLAADPSIWYSPYQRLLSSISFEWNHSLKGHLTFVNGQEIFHVPQWTVFYSIGAKMSALVTLPAALFLPGSLFSLRKGKVSSEFFLLIWLVSSLFTFSLLDIMVGTHYYLPLAVPVAFAGGYGLRMLARFLQRHLWPTRIALHKRWATVFLLGMLSLPHLLGLLSVPAAEGYTSEFFSGENQALQVAYPAYREAAEWLNEHTHGNVRIGLVALQNTLTGDGAGLTWFRANADLPARFSLSEVLPNTSTYNQDYLIWPMHLEQRGLLPPQTWQPVHMITGGKTTYCFILARTDMIGIA